MKALVARLRLDGDVEYNLSRSEVVEELRMWRSIAERRGQPTDGMKPRRLYLRISRENERYLVSSHRRIVFSVYTVEPGLGRLLVRRAGYEYARNVLEDVDSIEEAVYTLARRGVGILDFLGCRSGRCRFRIYECITCSGIELRGSDTLCEWEAGILEYISSKVLRARKPLVKEVKCWHTGYPYCEFLVLARG